MIETKEVIWLGVTPLERSTERVYTLTDKLGAISVSFPKTTSGMETYDSWKKYIGKWDIIATDQEVIDPSWEGFFEAANWGKSIVQYKKGEWTDVMPGFSEEIERK